MQHKILSPSRYIKKLGPTGDGPLSSISNIWAVFLASTSINKHDWEPHIYIYIYIYLLLLKKRKKERKFNMESSTKNLLAQN